MFAEYTVLINYFYLVFVDLVQMSPWHSKTVSVEVVLI